MESTRTAQSRPVVVPRGGWAAGGTAQRAVLSLAALALAGCGGEPSEAAAGEPVAVGICGPVDPAVGFAVHDSAGIRIVENLTPEWGRGEGISVAPDATAVIGADESDPDDVIGQLASALLLPDGRIAVADGSTHEIRIHAADGQLEYLFGGEGDGPGEFARSLGLYAGPGDTLVASHEAGRRYTVITADGTVVSTGSPGDGSDGMPRRYIRDVFPDGSLLLGDVIVVTPGNQSEPETEVKRLSWSFSRRLDPRVGSLDSIGRIPREDYFTYLHSSTGPYAGAFTFGNVPFGRVESYALGHGELFVGIGDVFQIERRAVPGGLRALFRVCEEQVPVDPAELQRDIDDFLDGLEPDYRGYEETALDGIPLPGTEPAHLEMHRDAAGRLWVRDFAPDWEDRIWYVFDDDGRWLGSATTPAGWEVRDIGTDRILLSGESELGVTTVRVYPIR